MKFYKPIVSILFILLLLLPVSCMQTGGDTGKVTSSAPEETIAETPEEPVETQEADEVIIKEGLVGYWKFDDGEGEVAEDSSGNGMNGTVKGAVWTEGKYGKALEFAGKESFLETELKLNQAEGSPGATFCAWVYPADTSPGRHHVISTDNRNYDWSLLREGDTWHVYTNRSSKSTEMAVDPEKWQFLAVVYNPKEGITFYKNNTSVKIEQIDFEDDTDPIFIGDSPGTWKQGFEGKIDEVLVYDRPLSKDEIEKIANMEISEAEPEETEPEETQQEENNSDDAIIVEEGLLGYWKFDEGEGTIAEDTSKNGKNGTINGAVWTEGKSGKALEFSEEKESSVISDLKINQSEGSAGATFSAWVYPMSHSNGRHQVVSFDNGSFDWSLLRLHDSWCIFSGHLCIDSKLEADIDQWQFIAVVFDPKEGITFYKNDESFSERKITFEDDTNSLAIGDNPAEQFEEYFDGKIDEVRVYDRPLSDEEIKEIYKKG